MTEKNKERDLYLYDQVDQNKILELTKSIRSIIKADNEERDKLKEFKEKPIRLFINSYGGEVDSMFAFINFIQASKTPIYTYCTGVAASAAFKIFLAGHKRYAFENTRMMYHQVQVFHYGYHAIKEAAENVKEEERLQELIEKFVLSRTKIPSEKLENVYTTKTDWWIHSDEYEKYGIIDEIIQEC